MTVSFQIPPFFLGGTWNLNIAAIFTRRRFPKQNGLTSAVGVIQGTFFHTWFFLTEEFCVFNASWILMYFLCFVGVLCWKDALLNYCLIHSKTGTTGLWPCLSLPTMIDIHFGGSMTLTRPYLGSFIFAFNLWEDLEKQRDVVGPEGFCISFKRTVGCNWFLFLLDVARVANATCKQKKQPLLSWNG